KVPDAFLDRLRDEFGFEPPRAHGYDTVDTIRAMRDGKIGVFFALGGNFVAATPDTSVSEAAMKNCALTVHVATKLNRSHLYHGAEALLLPCLSRRTRRASGGRAVRDRGGHHEHGARDEGTARPRVRTLAQRGGHCLRPRRGALWRGHWLERHARRVRDDPRPYLTRHRRLCGF